MSHFPESETVTETTVFTRTVSRGHESENLRRAMDSARKTAHEQGLELIVGLVDDLTAAQTGDDQAAADATLRVNNTVDKMGTLITDLQTELAASQGLAVTQSMIDKSNALKDILTAIDPDVAPPAPTPGPTPAPTPATGGNTTSGAPAGTFTQGTDANGNPMTDPTTGLPVDQNGQPNPAP